MHTNMQYLNSRRGVYSGLCVLVVLLSLLMLSSSKGYETSTTYGPITQRLAHQAGIQSHQRLGDTPNYTARIVKPDAGFFVHMPHGMMTALMWGILLGMLGLVVIGVKQRSVVMTALPGIIFITGVMILGQEYFQINPGSAENPILLVAIMTGVGVFLNRWKPAFIPRTPDAPPADPVSERRSEAEHRS